MCLLDWFRKKHSWDHLFRLLGQLGQDSRWKKAMFDDPEIATELAREQLEKPGAKWSPANADFTLINEQLAQLIDLQKAAMRMQSTTPNRKIEPFPRPITALSRELERLRDEQSEAGLARIYDLVAEAQVRWQEDHPEEQG